MCIIKQFTQGFDCPLIHQKEHLIAIIPFLLFYFKQKLLFSYLLIMTSNRKANENSCQSQLG